MNKLFRSALAAALISAPVLTVVPLMTPSASLAQSTSASTKWCYCNWYVGNRLRDSNPPLAQNFGSYLKQKGYRQIPGPQIKAIVVIQPGIPPLTGSRNGHVGVIEGYQTVGSSLKIHVRGTNQPGQAVHEEYGCNNVTVWSFSTNVNGFQGITYWTR
jgi:surface antigen